MHRSAERLGPAAERALHLAWESVCAGSLGIGAVAARDDGSLVAEGRNRLIERHPGDDHLAGSSLAHAELNVLAKLGFRRHEGDGLELTTTLQPCLQCLGAIRLAPIRRVTVLAPDPLWIGVERMRDLNPFVARNWPLIEQVPVDEWSVLALLLPTHQMTFWSMLLDAWHEHVPALVALCRRLVDDAVLVGHVERGSGLRDVADTLWDDLAECVDEVALLAASG